MVWIKGKSFFCHIIYTVSYGFLTDFFFYEIKISSEKNYLLLEELRFGSLLYRPRFWQRTSKRHCPVLFCCAPLARKTMNRRTGSPSARTWLRCHHLHRPQRHWVGFLTVPRLCTTRLSVPDGLRPYNPK